MAAWPVGSNSIVRSWQTAIGSSYSAPGAVAVQAWRLPLLSVTVRVTVLAPTLLTSKLVLSRLKLAMPQASVLPLLIWSGVIVPWPVASNWTVRFWQTANGGTESTTVTVAVAVWLLPLLSVTVRVTVFAPTLVQSKLLLSRLKLAMPQASLLPLSVWFGVMLPLPVAAS